MLRFLENNGGTLQALQASGCYDAIDDEVLEKIANMVKPRDEEEPAEEAEEAKEVDDQNKKK